MIKHETICFHPLIFSFIKCVCISRFWSSLTPKGTVAGCGCRSPDVEQIVLQSAVRMLYCYIKHLLWITAHGECSCPAALTAAQRHVGERWSKIGDYQDLPFRIGGLFISVAETHQNATHVFRGALPSVPFAAVCIKEVCPQCITGVGGSRWGNGSGRWGRLL